MSIKPLDQIIWATPQNPRGLWAYCVICNKDIRHLRTRKNVCSEYCRLIKQHNIDNRSYANKMAKDPDYAKKQSAKQYERIKSNIEKLTQHQEAQKKRMQMPNYQESAKRSTEKYRSNERYKQSATRRMRKYRDENPDIISKIEEKRVSKRSIERQRLKLEEPEKYQELLQKEREQANRRKAEKRLAELQSELGKLL